MHKKDSDQIDDWLDEAQMRIDKVRSVHDAIKTEGEPTSDKSLNRYLTSNQLSEMHQSIRYAISALDIADGHITKEYIRLSAKVKK